MENIFQTNATRKQERVATFITNRMDLKSKLVRTDKVNDFILIMGEFIKNI
jgi:hypothetical protein